MAQPVHMNSTLMNGFHSLWLVLIFGTAPACQSQQAPDAAAERVPHDAATSLAAQAQSTATASAQATTTNTGVAARIPENFSQYASESMGGEGRCVVGATTNVDGMDQRPVVYVMHGTGKQPQCVAQLDLPLNTYQSRATHCTSSGHSLFVLLQSDTQPEQTLSQTLLHIIRVDPATGVVQVQRDIQIAGASRAWVDSGTNHFQWDGSTLVVSGSERPSSSPDQQTHFTIHLDDGLELAGKKRR